MANDSLPKRYQAVAMPEESIPKRYQALAVSNDLLTKRYQIVAMPNDPLPVEKLIILMTYVTADFQFKCNQFVVSELNDPICHSNECQIGSFSSEATNSRTCLFTTIILAYTRCDWAA